MTQANRIGRTAAQATGYLAGGRHGLAWHKVGATALAAALVLSGCSGQMANVGTVAGAVVGKVAGEKIGGQTGAALGLLVGAALGQRFGQYLDEQDRQKLNEVEAQALRTGARGQFVPVKGGRMTVEPGAPVLSDRRPFTFAAGVTPRRMVLRDPETFGAFVDTPVFRAPTEQEAPRLLVRSGVAVTVVGTVQGLPDWSIVGDGDVGLGYVPTRFLRAETARTGTQYAPAADPAPPPPVAQAPAPAPTPAPPPPSGRNPSTPGGPVAKSPAPSPSPAPSSRKAPAPKGPVTKPATKSGPPPVVASGKEDYQKEVARAKVDAKPANPKGESTSPTSPTVINVSVECKTLKRTLEVPNSGEKIIEDVRYCNDPPKGWAPVTA